MQCNRNIVHIRNMILSTCYGSPLFLFEQALNELILGLKSFATQMITAKMGTPFIKFRSEQCFVFALQINVYIF